MPDIAGKLALVSGREAMDAAQALKARGVRVVLTDPDASWLDAAAQEMGGAAATLVADLSRHADVARVAAAMEALGGCDILVHAVPSTATAHDAWEGEFMSALRLSRPMVPQMLRGAWGRVIFLMAAGEQSRPQSSLVTFAKGIALSYSSRGVTFGTAVSAGQVPALCATPNSRIAEKSGEDREQNPSGGVGYTSVTLAHDMN